MGNCFACLKSDDSDRGGSDGLNATTTTPATATTARGAGTGLPGTTIPELVEKGETAELLAHGPSHYTSVAGTGDLQSGSLKKSALLMLNTNNVLPDTMPINAKEQHHQVSDNTLNALFEAYKDVQQDAILSDGIERLCADLGYRPDDFAILVLAWRLQASEMCRFTKAEFIQGLQSLRADTIAECRCRLEEIIDQLRSDADMFKQLYRFTFMFGLEPGFRIVCLDMAIILWRLVFTVHTPPILDRWLHYLEQHPNIRGVPKDTWNMFLNFAETCDITAYDDTEAWPSLFDDFVEYETDRCNQNVAKEEDKQSATTDRTMLANDRL